MADKFPLTFMERHQATVNRFRSGASARILAAELGFTCQYIYKVVEKFERLERAFKSPDSIDRLSTRAQNCLRAEDLDTREKITQALETGRLKKVPNLGAVTIAEIKDWLG